MQIQDTTIDTTRAAVATSRHHVRTAADLFNDTTIKPRDAIFGDWLLERGLAMIYAPSGLGKSWLGLSIATAVAGGGSLHDWKAAAAERVLLVDGEMDASDIKVRLGTVFTAADGDREKAGQNLLIWARKDPKAGREFPDLANEDGRAELLAVVREFKPKLVILDNLSTLATVQDENSADSWNEFLATLQALQQVGCAAVLIHHARKNNNGSGSYRGSQKLSVLLDIIIALSENPHAGEVRGSSFMARFEKSRGLTTGTGYELEAKFEAQEDGTSRWTFTKSSLGLIGEVVERVRDGEFASQKEIADAFGKDAATISRWKVKAIKNELITESEWAGCLRDARNARDEAPVVPAADPADSTEEPVDADF